MKYENRNMIAVVLDNLTRCIYHYVLHKNPTNQQVKMLWIRNITSLTCKFRQKKKSMILKELEYDHGLNKTKHNLKH